MSCTHCCTSSLALFGPPWCSKPFFFFLVFFFSCFIPWIVYIYINKHKPDAKSAVASLVSGVEWKASAEDGLSSPHIVYQVYVKRGIFYIYFLSHRRRRRRRRPCFTESACTAPLTSVSAVFYIFCLSVFLLDVEPEFFFCRVETDRFRNARRTHATV